MGRSTKSGKREMNPADAYRKEQRKKEIKKNKKDRKRVRELGAYVKDPDLLKVEMEKMEKMLTAGLLDHKLLGKLDQMRHLYPAIVKLHAKKKGMFARGGTVDDEELEAMLDEAEHASTQASTPKQSAAVASSDGQHPAAAAPPGHPPRGIPLPPPGPPPGTSPHLQHQYKAGSNSLQATVPIYGQPLPPPSMLPPHLVGRLPPPRPPRGPPPGLPRHLAAARGPELPPPPPGPPPSYVGRHGSPLLPTPTQSPLPPPYPQGPPPGAPPGIQPSGSFPSSSARPSARVQTVADPLDPSASNYGEYRKMSYVEHQRGGAGPQGQGPLPPAIMGPNMPPSGTALPQFKGPSSTPTLSTANFSRAAAAGPALGPVVGPSRPTQVAKDLVAFMPASLRVKRPVPPPSSAAAASIMRPRNVGLAPTAAAVVRPAEGSSAAGFSVVGEAVKPKAAQDSYDQFMSELSDLF
ncbi:Hypothetical protein NocV09_02100860 [Nannochloropsis oceanica]